MSRLFESTLAGRISQILIESEDVKPTKKTKEELIRDHGTDNVDLINAGKEPKDRVELKENSYYDLVDEIADFMIDYDKPGFEDSYEGDEDQKRDSLIQDITRDKETVIAYLNDIVTEELGTEKQQLEASNLLNKINAITESEIPTEEDLEKDDEEIQSKSKKEIEDRIGELRQAIQDGVSDDERTEMEKEIAELESKLQECDKSIKESDEYTRELGGFPSDAVKDLNNLKDCISKSVRNISFGSHFATEVFYNIIDIIDDNIQRISSKYNLSESVSVATEDGSTINTTSAASVSTDDSSVTLQTEDTTVVISKNCEEISEPEEQITEPVEEPTEVSDEQVPEDELSESNEVDDIDAKSLDVIKNQGNVSMIKVVNTDGNETYYVCDNFNAETNEADEAESFDNKEDADKCYFNRVELN